MPTEVGRTTARKRIALPGGGHVDVPVITKISFIDPNRGQETQYTIDNSHTSLRKVHVDTVYQTAGATSGPAIAVERIDNWPVFDANDRGQETQHTLDNVVTPPTDSPPKWTKHFKTHVVRYFNPGDQTQYIDSELIDDLRMVDANDRGQETQFILNNPPGNNEAQADPSDPEISDTDNGIDAPWRTDPFQNIVGFGDGIGAALLVAAGFRQIPGSTAFDATFNLGGWSVGDTWTGLPFPVGQGVIITASSDVTAYPAGSTDGQFFAYTLGTPIDTTAHSDWNDTFAFTITWSVKPPSGARQILTTQSYDVSGATYVHAGIHYEIAGTHPVNILYFNRWTDESFPPHTPGIPPGVTSATPVLWLLFVPVTA